MTGSSIGAGIVAGTLVGVDVVGGASIGVGVVAGTCGVSAVGGVCSGITYCVLELLEGP